MVVEEASWRCCVYTATGTVTTSPPRQVERILAGGNFPRFAGNTVRNIETSWATVMENMGIEDAGGRKELTRCRAPSSYLPAGGSASKR